MTVPEGDNPLLDLDVPQPALLFDLDGTLVDSVYQHVIAWQEALAEVGIPLSVWRIHRRIGMSGGLFLDALQRETGVPLTDGAAGAAQGRARRGVPPSGRQRRPAAGCPRAARPPARPQGALRDRHQRRAADGAQRDRDARPARRRAGGHPRPGRAGQARPAPVPGGGAPARRTPGALLRGRRQRVGPAGRPARRVRSGSGCSPAATAARSSSGRGPTASTPTRPRCSPASRRSASGPDPASCPRSRGRLLPVHGTFRACDATHWKRSQPGPGSPGPGSKELS